MEAGVSEEERRGGGCCWLRGVVMREMRDAPLFACPCVRLQASSRTCTHAQRLRSAFPYVGSSQRATGAAADSPAEPAAN